MVRPARPAIGAVVRWVLLALLAALAIGFARGVDWAAVGGAARGASPGPLLLGAVIHFGSFAAKSAIWWIFLQPIGGISYALALRATAVGYALNNVVIAHGGDAARVVIVGREHKVSTAPVLAALALERLFDVVGYIVVLGLAVLLLPLPEMFAPARIPAMVLLALVTVAAAVVLLRHPRSRFARRIDVRATDATHGVPRGTPDGGAFGRAVRAMSAYLRHFGSAIAAVPTRRRLFAALGLSLASWACQVATYHLIARAAGLPISLVGSLAATLAVNLSLVARVTPGHVGVWQLAYAMAATAFGISRDAALGAAFLIQMTQNIPTTLLGVLLAPGIVVGRHRAP
jgi:uncharacterized protein (TIRG00374 family)